MPAFLRQALHTALEEAVEAFLHAEPGVQQGVGHTNSLDFF